MNINQIERQEKEGRAFMVAGVATFIFFAGYLLGVFMGVMA